MSRRPALVVATVAYLALVAWATFGTVSFHRIGWQAEYGVLSPSTWFDSATWSVGSPVEWGLNVAMFVPIGVLFAMLAGRRRWLVALLAAAALSAAIEIAQIPIDDRISDPRDLAANSTGAVIGVAIAAIGWLVAAVARRIARAAPPVTTAPGTAARGSVAASTAATSASGRAVRELDRAA
ncbi:VanZ family protein [Agromyces larvae]|uniref:VanZ family protein n=1 Tax=Agromyces larvae TaxID=2929802 RepID=A0ABY4BY54_9MICO|nr:VanZ family protein [Agromyces larvae]UOE42796.1 VanZ family protein [Agromyces larvae]